MPDICMCPGDGCTNKDNCYRHIAIPDYYQTYFVAAPIDNNGNCLYFWESGGRAMKRREESKDDKGEK
jgi:hypothetical protein